MRRRSGEEEVQSNESSLQEEEQKVMNKAKKNTVSPALYIH